VRQARVPAPTGRAAARLAIPLRRPAAARIATLRCRLRTARSLRPDP
jgi:hypothetical protein